MSFVKELPIMDQARDLSLQNTTQVVVVTSDPKGKTVLTSCGLSLAEMHNQGYYKKKPPLAVFHGGRRVKY